MISSNILYTVIIIVFMGILLLAAKQDFEAGEVDAPLILLPFPLFILIYQRLHFAMGIFILMLMLIVSNMPRIRKNPAQSSIINGELSFTESGVVSRRMGGADIIIFTQLALLFGDGVFFILFISSAIALLRVTWTGIGIRKGETSSKTILQQEIRFIPAIFAAALIYIILIREGFL